MNKKKKLILKQKEKNLFLVNNLNLDTKKTEESNEEN